MVRNLFGSPSGGGINASPSASKQSRKERLEQAKQAAAAEKSRRRNFGFLNTGDKRMSNKSISRTREHAKQLAEAYNDPDTSFFPQQQQHASFQDDAPFDPFGTLATKTTPTTTKSTPSKGNMQPQHQQQHHFAAFDQYPPEKESTASTADSFETASVGSAYDMDSFLPNNLNHQQYSTPKQVKVKRRTQKGPTLDQFVGGGGGGGFESDHHSNPHNSFDTRSRNGERSVISMPTMPANSSMQASFARQNTTGSNNSSSNSSVVSGTGAAARRRMRSQMRQSSNSSVCSASSDASSYCSTPPESPSGSVRSTNNIQHTPTKNRLTAYQRTGTGSFYSQNSSSINSQSGGSDNLFSDGMGGFTFDAFGLDQSQVEKDVDRAMQDLAGQGISGFSMFLNTEVEEDFAPDNWDSSPLGSRQSSPVPSDKEDEQGFVDGFRVTPSSVNSDHRSRFTRQHSQPTERSPAAAMSSSSRSRSQTPASRGPVQARAKSTPPQWERRNNNDMNNVQQQQQQQQDSIMFDEPAANPWNEDPWGSDPEDNNSKEITSSDVGTNSDFGGGISTKYDIIQSSPYQVQQRYADSKSDFGAEPHHFNADFGSMMNQNENEHRQSKIQDGVAQEFAADFVARFSPRHSQQQHAVDIPNSDDDYDVPSRWKYGSQHTQQQDHVFEANFGADGAASVPESPRTFGPGAHTNRSAASQFAEEDERQRMSYGEREHPVFAAQEEQDPYNMYGDDSTQQHHAQYQNSNDIPANYEPADYGPVRSNFPTPSKGVVSEPISKSKFASFRSKYESTRESNPMPPSQGLNNDCESSRNKPTSASYQSPSISTGNYNSAEQHLYGDGYHPQPHDDPTSPRNGHSTTSNDDDVDVPSRGRKVATAPHATYGNLRNSYAAATSKVAQGGKILDENKATQSAEHTEEKKEDDNGIITREPENDVGSLKAKWRQWESKATTEFSPQRSIHQRYTVQRNAKKKSAVEAISTSLDVEILTPDIVEERRQEKRRIRTEELKKTSEEQQQVPLRSPQSTLRKTPEKSVSTTSDQRQNESVDQPKSFVSLRERLKPSIARDEVKSKSEPGSGSKTSLATGVIDRLRKESPSSDQAMGRNFNFTETKSESGSTPSFLASVKLRKTNPARLTGDGTPVSTGADDEIRSPTNVEYDQRSPEPKIIQQSPEAVNSPEPDIPVKKLTYRDRRELELRRQEEQKSKLEAQQDKGPQKKDVAALIRKRIAANKQRTAEASKVEDNDTQPINGIRGRLKPVSRDVAMPLSPEVDHSDLPPGSPRFTRPLAEEQTELSMKNPETSLPSHESSHSRRFPSPTKSPVGSPRKNGSSHSSGFSSPTKQKHATLEEAETDSRSFHPPNISTSDGDQMLHKVLSPSSEMEYSADERTPSNYHSRKAASPRRMESELSVGSPKKGNSPLNAFGATGSINPVVASQDSNAIQNSSQQDSAVEENPSSAKDVKAMLGNFLGAKMSSIKSSLPAPAKEDDAQALLRRKNHENATDEERRSSPQPPPPPATVTAGGRPALKDDPKYERYFRMLKVGMPMEVVKHAMQKDGNDPNVMDGDHNKPVGLPLKEDPKYTKYFKMLKLGVSMPQVKHSMQMDGLMPEVMDQDHNLPAAACEQRSKKEPKEKSTHRRARLHWTTHQKVQRNSLWAKLEQDSEMNIEIDEVEFNELFQAELQPALLQSPSKGLGANRKKGAAVRVIDAKRANNGGIILARVKMTHDEMADAVDRIDGDALSAEQIENIIEFLPTKEEREQLEKYMLEGDEDAADKFDGLCECEKFMVSMMTVKHAKRKVRALLFKLQFFSCLESIAEDARTVDSACEELRNSNRLRQLLGIVLQFGNRLNTAGNSTKRKAGAFSLDSLLKLNQAKAFDKKTTFLHYIVLIVQRNSDLLLNFVDDLPTVPKADKIYWDQCLSDLEEVENQLENVRRISLHEARMKKLKKSHEAQRETKDDDSLADMDMTLEEEVEALRSTRTGLFTLSAIKQVSALRDQVEVTGRKFMRLLTYFGEDDKKVQPHELFNIFSVFCRDFGKAKEEVFANVKKRMREERKKNRNQATPAGKGNGKPPTGPDRNNGTRPLMRLSSHQPNMGRVIKDLQNSATKGKQQQQQKPSQVRNVPDKPRNAGNGNRSQQTHRYPKKSSPQVAPKAANSASTIRNTPNAVPGPSSYNAGPIDVPEAPIPKGMQESGRFEELEVPESAMDSKAQQVSSPPVSDLGARNNIRQKALARRKMQIVSGRTTPVVSNTSNTRTPDREPKPSHQQHQPQPSPTTSMMRQTPPREVNMNTNTVASPRSSIPASAPRSAPPKLSSHMMRHRRRMEAQRQATQAATSSGPTN